MLVSLAGDDSTATDAQNISPVKWAFHPCVYAGGSPCLTFVVHDNDRKTSCSLQIHSVAAATDAHKQTPRYKIRSNAKNGAASSG
jgi:hypothetical protein